MQTFLPYADFTRSAEVLDIPRLGKQRVETLQVARALELYDYGWSTHPAVRMWRGHTAALVAYGLAFVEVWTRDGRADTTAAQIAEFAPDVVGRSQSDLAADGLMPPWLGDDRLHRSHRSALLRKDRARYLPEFGDIDDSLPYFWPDEPRQPVAATPLDHDGPRMWVIRPATDDAYREFVRRKIVGLDTASGVDVDASEASVEAHRALMRQRSPGRRPGKDLRVLTDFVCDIAAGDAVAIPIPESSRLRVGEVTGDYRFSGRASTGVPHRRPVRWTGTLDRSDIDPPALLQNPRMVFPVPTPRP